MVSTAIEVTIWMALLSGMGLETLGGFGRESYLAYALWATFIGRITTSWMYEFQMMEQIDTGRINGLLTRPISFYEFYLSQFMGYKLICIVFSLGLPILACWIFSAPLHLDRLPLVLLMLLYFLVFVHTLSFTVACMAFFLNRIYSFTPIKNLLIWVLAGELIPLDLYPEPIRSWLLLSPFAAGVYYPVSYLTGRIGTEAFLQSFTGITIGLVVTGLLARVIWLRGLRVYTGTGA